MIISSLIASRPRPELMNRLWPLVHRIRPDFEHFQADEVNSLDLAGIDHLALEVGNVLSHQMRHRALGWRRGLVKFAANLMSRPEQLPMPTTWGAKACLTRLRQAVRPGLCVPEPRALWVTSLQMGFARLQDRPSLVRWH